MPAPSSLRSRLAATGGAAVVATGALALYTCARQAPSPGRIVEQATRETLVPFRDERELRGYLAKLALFHTRRSSTEDDFKQDEPDGGPAGAGARSYEFEDDAVAGEMAAPAAAEPSVSPDGESITNTQEAGVDEGGIVKVHGDHLVVLRRGRLFTVSVADGQLRPIAALDVTPPGGRPASWYDEMLVHRDTIIVVGFSYEAPGTELGFFAIDAHGGLRHRATYWLRSGDYYSARNYASRLLGDTFLFYMPYPVLKPTYERGRVLFTASLPGLKRWQRGGREDWSSIVEATRVYHPIQPTLGPVLHTVVACELAGAEPSCRARGVLGPAGRTFYVSRSAVYVWVPPDSSAWSVGELDPALRVGWNGARPRSALYRLPLDGSEPGALRASGTPTDQFSFQERDGVLSVLLRAQGGGDGMWGSELTAGDVTLLRVPVAAITAGVATARSSSYRVLPRPGAGYTFQNRFVGDHVLYGTGSSWGPPDPSDRRVFVHDLRSRRTAEALPLPGGVDRIEPLGSDALVVGTDGRNLHLTSIRLAGGPALAGHHVEPNAAQGETRSHGFFFRSDGDEDGVLGLPVRGGGEAGWLQLVEGSAGVLFLRVADLRLSTLGLLASRAAGPQEDGCVASCVDWYGNARPIFLRGRVIALLGYELVEGRIDGGRIREIGRADVSSLLARLARPAPATAPAVAPD